jgi:hypothetical protein
MGGLLLSFGLLVALVARGILTREVAHDLIDEQMALLEDLSRDPLAGPGAHSQISSGLRDLSWLRQMLHQHPMTRLPE